MACLKHTVLTGASLSDFISHVEEQRVAGTIVACSTKETFLEQLLAACLESLEMSSTAAEEVKVSEVAPPSKYRLLQQPSLRMLATSQKIKLAFCPDISHLRAYLATYKGPKVSDQGSVLAILNPIELHRPTSAFSAQDLNRAFSLAVEAAVRTNSRLLISEVPASRAGTPHPEMHQAGPAADIGAEEPPSAPPVDAWDEEVSILNVTTKSFGAGRRGWFGRTAKIKRVAERWCTFEQCSPRSSSP